ncbi:hypothetical protein ARTSIC4J27_568 [Pseudarthrobacter siccitolerans]|uniref:Uncharacterized protein n=1 Tax=Pseudarthrobacter siccitolerans TaxID=861266 RepID=A0A024GYT3_9MICC|nr:hypothetical protein [Pseudarthrobacter siccitolerans]CCQ44641.1 hypothetical protein ARTSIC4J27_568 [Pseudarthrobacter siccitolerans]
MSAALNRLRGLAYRLGLRPRRGSILYSPSRDFALAGRRLADAFADAFEEALS